MPGFLGGSDLAVPVGADKALGGRLDQGLHQHASEKALQAIGNIPNTTSLLDNPSRSTSGRRARSWFVPTAKNWVNVENGNILRNMLAADPDRQADRQAGGAVGERQHRVESSTPRPSNDRDAELVVE